MLLKKKLPRKQKISQKAGKLEGQDAKILYTAKSIVSSLSGFQASQLPSALFCFIFDTIS